MTITCSGCGRAVFKTDVDAGGRCVFCQPAADLAIPTSAVDDVVNEPAADNSDGGALIVIDETTLKGD
mgnify:CR=1 FL=1